MRLLVGLLLLVIGTPATAQDAACSVADYAASDTAGEPDCRGASDSETVDAATIADMAAEEAFDDNMDVEVAATVEPSPEDLWPERESGIWTVYPDNDSGCAMVGIFSREGEAAIGVIYGFDAETRLASIYFENYYATSLTHGQKVNLAVQFLDESERNLDDGWGLRTFMVNQNTNGSIGFYSENFDDELLSDLGKNDTIIFRTESDALVVALGLEGTAKATALLRECAFTVAGLNPKDPFLQ